LSFSGSGGGEGGGRAVNAADASNPEGRKLTTLPAAVLGLCLRRRDHAQCLSDLHKQGC